MSPQNLINKLKTKYNITSNKDFVLILLVFSLAGMSVSISRKTIFVFLGLNHKALIIQIVASLLLIVPLYQISTLFFSFIFGNFKFFWERQKALGRFLKRVFVKSS